MTKILLIDDDLSYNSMLKEYLEAQHYTVISAFDGQQGFNLFKQEHPDVIITDIVMPEEDGIGLLMKILTYSNPCPCKIIAISGGGRFGGENYLNTAQELGVDAVFGKPFDLSDLHEKIQSLLANASQ